MMVQSVGGQKRDVRAVAADSFTFAGVGFKNTQFILLGRIGGPGVVGNIGENLMGPFDVEYDLANGVIRYFNAKGCGYEANLAYWSQGMALSRLWSSRPTSILLSVVTNAKVDGHTIRVTFGPDRRCRCSANRRRRRAGIEVNSDGVVNGEVSYGIYGRASTPSLRPSRASRSGTREIKNTKLRVARIDMPRATCCLGADCSCRTAS